MDIKTYKLNHRKPPKSFEYIADGNDDPKDYIDGLWDEYFCWNQNGFNNALYYHFEANDKEKKGIREQARYNYPLHYPCIMKIWRYHTFEAGRLIAEFEYE